MNKIKLFNLQCTKATAHAADCCYAFKLFTQIKADRYVLRKI